MNIFISGGCKNGKSFFAQQAAKKRAQEKNAPLYYLATMIPCDQEDRARIKRHVAERKGWGFTTIEQGTDICGALKKADAKGVFLLDSVTALLSNEMFAAPASGNTDLKTPNIDLHAPERVKQDLIKFAESTGDTIFVSDFLYSDPPQYDDLTEAYRKGLAHCDRALAAICGQVIEVCYGNQYFFK